MRIVIWIVYALLVRFAKSEKKRSSFSFRNDDCFVRDSTFTLFSSVFLPLFFHITYWVTKSAESQHVRNNTWYTQAHGENLQLVPLLTFKCSINMRYACMSRSIQLADLCVLMWITACKSFYMQQCYHNHVVGQIYTDYFYVDSLNGCPA